MGNCRCYICFNFNGNILIIESLNDYWVNLENKKDKRIAITPEIVKKYISLGFEIFLVKNYGSHLGFSDNEFLDVGVKFKDEKEIVKNSNIITQLGILSDEKLSMMSEKQILIGVLNPYDNKDKLQTLVKKSRHIFFRTFTKNNKSSIYGYLILTSKSCRL